MRSADCCWSSPAYTDRVLPGWEWVDIAVPRPSDRLPGISMAGFRQRAPAPRTDIDDVAWPGLGGMARA
jgi:hypothetical protein